MSKSKNTLHTVFSIFDIEVMVSAIDQKAKAEYQRTKESKKECKDAEIFDDRSFLIETIAKLYLKSTVEKLTIN